MCRAHVTSAFLPQKPPPTGGEIGLEIAPLLVRSFIRDWLDTSASTFSAVFYHLAIAPDQYARLHHDPLLIRRVMDEAMRLETPIQTVCRLTMKDVEFDDGIVVPENNKSILLLASANRDPSAWEKPDRFRLTVRLRYIAVWAPASICVSVR